MLEINQMRIEMFFGCHECMIWLGVPNEPWRPFSGSSSPKKCYVLQNKSSSKNKFKLRNLKGSKIFKIKNPQLTIRQD